MDVVALGLSLGQFPHPVPSLGFQPRAGVGAHAGDRHRSVTKVGVSVSPESGPSLAPIVLFTNPNSVILSWLASQ